MKTLKKIDLSNSVRVADLPVTDLEQSFADMTEKEFRETLHGYDTDGATAVHSAQAFIASLLVYAARNGDSRKAGQFISEWANKYWSKDTCPAKSKRAQAWNNTRRRFQEAGKQLLPVVVVDFTGGDKSNPDRVVSVSFKSEQLVEAENKIAEQQEQAEKEQAAMLEQVQAQEDQRNRDLLPPDLVAREVVAMLQEQYQNHDHAAIIGSIYADMLQGIYDASLIAEELAKTA